MIKNQKSRTLLVLKHVCLIVASSAVVLSSAIGLFNLGAKSVEATTASRIVPITTSFAASCPQKGFIVSSAIFTPWYKYLDGEIDNNGRCHPIIDKDDLGGSLSQIGVALIELAIHLSGIIAVGFFVYGAIQYTVSQGESAGISSAKTTMINSMIGLVIVLLSSGIVQFIGNTIKNK